MYNLWLIKNCAFEFLDMVISEGKNKKCTIMEKAVISCWEK